MKRKLALALMWVYLLTATELNQFWKLPIFVSHFIEHRAETPGITLSEFVVLHYFSGDVRDADYARDEELPFRDNTHSLIGCISTTVPSPPQFDLDDFAPGNINMVPKTMDGKPNRYQTDIWQPPKHQA